VRVWVDAWQLQCCGTPFDQGQPVVWTLSPQAPADWLVSAVGKDTAETIDYREYHHGTRPADAREVHGVVAEIKGLQCQFEPPPGGDAHTLVPVAESGEFTALPSASGWDRDTEGLCFTGYLVDLEVPDN
jgi:hypothetical protein